MKRFKRIVAIVLASVLALGVLTGCCAGFRKDEMGEALVEAAMECINTGRDENDQLENNETVRRKLQWMLNQIDEDTLELDDEYQYLIKIDGDGAPSQTAELYYVMPNEFRSEDGSPESLTSFLSQLKSLAENNNVKITEFAVTYLVIKNDKVGDNLFVAVGGKIEGNIPVNLFEV